MMFYIIGFIYFSSAITCGQMRVARLDPLVLTTQGVVRGQLSTDGGDYSSFLGIPYAQVDMNNPFGASLPPPMFEDVFDATDGSIACPQNNEGTLDCLRLNIYVPNQATSTNPVPVLVWIHGGGFSSGKAGFYSAPNLVSENIILVSINYRLGAYGFLTLNNPKVPGNQGLKDQYAALKWVKDNISAFGGDPNSITLIGQSAGSSSVMCHLYSPQEKLFQKVILESGVTQGGGFFVTPDEQIIFKLSEYLGFNTTDDEEALEFLSSLSPELVTSATSQLRLAQNLRPCKERSFEGVERFVTDDPFTMSNPQKIKDTAILIGSTSCEQYGSVNIESNVFYEELNKYFNFKDNDLGNASDALKHFYIGDESINENVIPELEDFYTDFIFNHPIERSIVKFIEEGAGPIYRYIFNYVGEGDRGVPNRAPHTSELKYVFASNYETFNDEQKLLTDRVTQLWSNFIKYGNPTPQMTELVPFAWDQVTVDRRPYLTIDSELQLSSRYRKESMAFWTLFYTIYGEYNYYNDNEFY